MACILQECKALNSRVIDFLKLPESVAKLLEYITQPAGLDANDKRQFKYPFSSAEVRARSLSGGAPTAQQHDNRRKSVVAQSAEPSMICCLHNVLAGRRMQVLCCEVDAVFSTLLEDGALCGALFALLDQPRPLDCMLAGYFARVLVCLLMRRSRDLLRYLKVRRSPVSRLNGECCDLQNLQGCCMDPAKAPSARNHYTCAKASCAEASGGAVCHRTTNSTCPSWWRTWRTRRWRRRWRTCWAPTTCPPPSWRPATWPGWPTRACCRSAVLTAMHMAGHGGSSDGLHAAGHAAGLYSTTRALLVLLGPSAAQKEAQLRLVVHSALRAAPV